MVRKLLAAALLIVATALPVYAECGCEGTAPCVGETIRLPEESAVPEAIPFATGSERKAETALILSSWFVFATSFSLLLLLVSAAKKSLSRLSIRNGHQAMAAPAAAREWPALFAASLSHG